MTGGLEHKTPAETTKSPTPQRQQIWPEKSGKKSSLKLFDDPVNAPAIDLYADDERAVRVAVSANFEAEIARPKAAQRPAEGRALDKGDATLTPAGVDLASQPEKERKQKDSLQVERWRLKHIIANILRAATPEGGRTPGVCKCGTAKRCNDGSKAPFVTFYNEAGRAGIKGVYYCDSPWLCSTCAPRCAAQRAERVQRVFDATEKKGGQVVFLTLTVRHGPEDSLKDLKRIVTDACRKARQGKPWALAVKRHDIQGVMVGPEVTWSKKAGWHFHLHLAVPMIEKANGEKSAEDRAKEAGEWIISRYLSYIRNEGGKVERRYYEPAAGQPAALREAQDVQVVWRREDLADYLAKGSAAWEVAAAGATKTRTKNRPIGGMTPWDLAALAGRGDGAAASKFVEYAKVMPGTKSCIITKALADNLGIEPDDGEIAADEDAEETDNVVIVGSLETPRWHRVLRLGYAPDVLRAVGHYQPWPVIDNMVRRFLGEEESEPAETEESRQMRQDLEQMPPLRVRPLPPPPELHAPALSDLVREINQAAVLQFRGNKGRAVQAALAAHRAKADAAKLPCVFPQFAEIWQALAA